MMERVWNAAPGRAELDLLWSVRSHAVQPTRRAESAPRGDRLRDVPHLLHRSTNIRYGVRPLDCSKHLQKTLAVAFCFMPYQTVQPLRRNDDP